MSLTSEQPAELTPRSKQAVVSFVLLIVLAAVAAFLPVPFVALSPGPTFNTIGEYNGTPLITISKQPTYATRGHLDLVTVRETGGPQGGLDLVTAIRGWFDSTVEIVPKSVLYPPMQRMSRYVNSTRSSSLTPKAKPLQQP